MRIICPGCRAEYAIPDNAVPAAGREVQCAACTHAWYQLPAASPQDPPPFAAPGSGADSRVGPDVRPGAGPPVPGEGPAPSAAPPPATATEAPERRIERLRAALGEVGRSLSAADPAPAVPAPGAAMASAAEAADDEEPSPEPAVATAPSPRRIDPGVLRILREEAAFEARARAGEPVMRLTPAQDRLARLQQAERDGAAFGPADSEAAVEDPDAARHAARPPLIRAAASDPRPAARATPPALRPGANGRDLPVRLDPRGVAAYRARQHRKGFRAGYGASLGICCAALVLYLGAPQMARWLPAGTPLAEMVIDHGNRVQAALMGALRSVLAPGGPPGAS